MMFTVGSIGRSAALTWSACALVITLILVAPRDEASAHAVMFPTGCAPPCVFGILPGISSPDHAEARLRALPYVADITRVEGGSFEIMRWSWNGAQPDLLTPPDPFSTPFLTVDGDVVRLIYVPTRIPKGDVWAWFGAPDAQSISLSGRSPWVMPSGATRALDNAMVYGEGVLEIQTLILCPIERRKIWYAPTQWLFSEAGSARPSLQTMYVSGYSC